MKQSVRSVIVAVLSLALPALAFASGGGVIELETNLVIQLGALLLAVRLGGSVAHRLKMPAVLGELAIGMVVGPYALGAIPLPGFPHGLFAGSMGAIAVSTELYGISTVASIILLFVSGLETDLSLFMRYSVRGGIVGLGGVFISFGAGALGGSLLFGGSFFDPANLFLGVMSTATSVGITARILADRRKMDSPEGVTILAAAVFDDVLGIVALAVVMGMVEVSRKAGSLDWGGIGLIALRAFGIWLGVTALGLLTSKAFAKALKRLRTPMAFSFVALGCALLLAGFFEKEGLAMIIGAYVMGLSLSKTDIAQVIIEKVHVLYEFFVPIFFAVMGMLVDVRLLGSPAVLIAGLVFTLVAIGSKVLGCAIPALFLGFNWRGALRVGVGMVPRGEVALIVAGIGAAAGFLEPTIFGVSVLMTLLTTLVAPPALSATLALAGKGTRKPSAADETVHEDYELPNEDIAALVLDSLIRDLQAEGFYVQTMAIEEGICQVRKDEIAFSLERDDARLSFQSGKDDALFVRTALFESVAKIYQNFAELRRKLEPEKLARGMDEGSKVGNAGVLEAVDRGAIVLGLKAGTKEEAIEELIDRLDARGKLEDRKLALADVLERERSMSTGMTHGIAMPHAKTDAVEHQVVAVGVSRHGVDFQCHDGSPATVVTLILTPKRASEPHLQLLAALGATLNDEERRTALLASVEADEAARALGLPDRRTGGGARNRFFQSFSR
ncbi:MAG: cation:proton antiporter [Spirochaetales bacterium]|nr:cation:proton antiporter [Spirochaetales bacterium]